MAALLNQIGVVFAGFRPENEWPHHGGLQIPMPTKTQWDLFCLPKNWDGPPSLWKFSEDVKQHTELEGTHPEKKTKYQQAIFKGFRPSFPSRV